MRNTNSEIPPEGISIWKTVKCSYGWCHRRCKHHELPDVNRKHQEFEVPINSPGPWYCSIECACLDGSFDVKTGWKLSNVEKRRKEIEDGRE